jgi:hypothetical protein
MNMDLTWILVLTEIFHVVMHSLVLLGRKLVPEDPTIKVAYFMLDVSMGAMVLSRSIYLEKPDRGSLWGILYGINIVNHCRALAFILGQPDPFMEQVYHLSDTPSCLNLLQPSHRWFVVGTLVDIYFHAWNSVSLVFQ